MNLELEADKNNEEFLKYALYPEEFNLKRIRYVVKSVSDFTKNREPSNVSILDIGCGASSIGLPLASIGYQVLGVDIDQHEIGLARKNNSFSNAVFEVQDANDMVLKRTFDVVICSEVIEHLHEPQILLDTVLKLLSPRGIMILTTPNGFGPYEMLYETPMRWIRGTYRKLKRKPKLSREFMHVQNFKFQAFLSLLADSGFKVERVGKSNVLSFLSINSTGRFARWDCDFADRLPEFLVSGWYFTCTNSTS